ncbi:MAG: methyltransferase [Clostridiales bacterium]|nr:methyltransferase [Clostridiales bacterium]
MTGGDNKISVRINPDERIEPLDDKHVILQSVNGYRCGSDAVALSKFASEYVKQSDNVFDLCSGCGIIGLLLAIETGCNVVGAELDKSLFDMSVRSCELNGLDNVRFFNADIRDLSETANSCAYDIVVCNPPFFKADSRMRKVAPTANSELTVTFDDVVKAAKRLLKTGGALFLVHTSSRLDEVLSACRSGGLTPKNLVVNKNCKTFMLRAVRGGKDGLTLTVKEF